MLIHVPTLSRIARSQTGGTNSTGLLAIPRGPADGVCVDEGTAVARLARPMTRQMRAFVCQHPVHSHTAVRDSIPPSCPATLQHVAPPMAQTMRHPYSLRFADAILPAAVRLACTPTKTRQMVPTRLAGAVIRRITRDVQVGTVTMMTTPASRVLDAVRVQPPRCHLPKRRASSTRGAAFLLLGGGDAARPVILAGRTKIGPPRRIRTLQKSTSCWLRAKLVDGARASRPGRTSSVARRFHGCGRKKIRPQKTATSDQKATRTTTTTSRLRRWASCARASDAGQKGTRCGR